jgi:DNA-3-methyladenine glycosylase II
VENIITASVASAAAKHLASNDETLAPVIPSAGLCPLRPHANYYWALVDAIISQQLSVKAAASIEARFQRLFASEVPKPEQILAKTTDELRSVGLSNAKANYVRDLARHVASGTLALDKFASLSDEEITAELTSVKGIGEWTAHMFLLFCMARTRVLPVGDLGIRNSVRKLYGFDHLPTASEIEALASANNWRPYESIASWYLWQNLANTPEV